MAQSSVAQVDRCSCGAVQLHLGAVTLRFAPEAFAELVSTLNEAAAASDALQESAHQLSQAAFGRARGNA